VGPGGISPAQAKAARYGILHIQLMLFYAFNCHRIYVYIKSVLSAPGVSGVGGVGGGAGAGGLYPGQVPGGMMPNKRLN